MISYLMAETGDWGMSQNCIVSVKFLKDVRDFDRNATNSVKKKTIFTFCFISSCRHQQYYFHAAGRYRRFCMIQNPPGT
jgi:hypothetical protein